MNTCSFALIGHPIGHSMSPFLHSKLFALSGVNASYTLHDISPENLASSVPFLRTLDGFNITIPHKETIIRFLDSLDPRAEEAGSVNTVKNVDGRLIGYTTDGEGFRRALEFAGVPLGGRVAILGAGGAARAIAFEAAHAGARITVAAREHSLPSAQRLCAELRAKIPGTTAESCLISNLSGTWDLLVNATPAGMIPHPETCAASEELVANSACVFDAVYNPDETKLLSIAKRLGKKAVGGVGMLVCQAAAAEEIWLGTHFSAKDLQALFAETSLQVRARFGNLTLCGFMGCGKTTCGRILAKRLNRRFVDLDEYIEQKQGMSVSEIFAKKGEPAFRQMETDAVKELSHSGGLVIAAGGGTLLKPENAAALRANGIVVLLDASLEAVRERLKDDTARPLLHQPNSADAIDFLYRERLAGYRAAADFTVPADGTPEETVESVIRLLSLA
ncbi:MAG: Multifunctional fusion protein [Thermocaproicibacter melissae]|uniref:shikimate dehydrogenase n=1 Tax=Thermocaproicibacter melissae TaxID=2966552 RepID=UPI0024B17C17|nr:shikimate dehydrogenase [Thermocaproicibacter melissae]WBY63753.1 shikimate dehydrogenase [Thermocaproicibacter melissae]